jgi:AcrB/AcrD/AcrF family
MQALVNAAVLRLRPVLITVGATAFALVPLAVHGGPLWEPLCYAQIGGLLLSAIVTLLLVPTIYAFVVLDLRWITWRAQSSATSRLEALSSLRKLRISNPIPWEHRSPLMNLAFRAAIFPKLWEESTNGRP